MRQDKVVFYSDERGDHFAGTDIKAVKVGADFPFLPKAALFRVFEFIAYYLIALPIVAVIWFVFGGFRIYGRGHIKALRRGMKPNGKKGFFLYANHTHWLDAFCGPLVCFPVKCHVLVSPDTVSMKGLRTVGQLLGAIPVPTERGAYAPFNAAIEARIAQGRAIMIFPEAHIWPYCTFIRDFKPGSFRYPVKEGAACVPVCVTYTRRRPGFLKAPARRVFIDRPIMPDAALPQGQAKQQLRDAVYERLRGYAEKYSDYAVVKYVKKPPEAGE